MSQQLFSVHTGAEVGVMVPWGSAWSEGKTAISDRFFLGGVGSLRGFRTRSVGPVDARRPHIGANGTPPASADVPSQVRRSAWRDHPPPPPALILSDCNTLGYRPGSADHRSLIMCSVVYRQLHANSSPMRCGCRLLMLHIISIAMRLEEISRPGPVVTCLC